VKIVYTPEGQPAQEWNLLPGKIRESRAEMIERRYARLIGEKSVPFEQWRMALLQDEASARRVALWHLLNLIHPTLKIEDVDYVRDELKVTASKLELGELRISIETAGGLDDAQREAMLANIDVQIAAAHDDQDDAGKALSTSSGNVTGSPSPTTSPASEPSSSTES
jgi:hypothetical protein